MARKKTDNSGSVTVIVRDADGHARHTGQHSVDDVDAAIAHVRELEPEAEEGSEQGDDLVSADSPESK